MLDGLRGECMRSDIFFTVSPCEWCRLRVFAANPEGRRKHVWRLRVVLVSGEGVGTMAVMVETHKSSAVQRQSNRNASTRAVLRRLGSSGKSDLMSGLLFPLHIEVLSTADTVRHRHWSDADKIHIVEEGFAG